MQSFRSGLVDLVRDFLLLHQRMRVLFDRYRDGTLQFREVRALVGDGQESLLFRLKESCHALFRGAGSQSSTGVRREALFDLAVGSLFHEAMKFRENLYQLEVYAPKVKRLQMESGDGVSDLFREFEKITKAAAMRLDEALHESEALLDLTRRQLLDLLVDHQHDGLVVRTLLENRALVEDAFAEGLDPLLAKLCGSAGAAYRLAAHSYLESARFDEARQALIEAREQPGEAADLSRLFAYAEGMSAFLAGDYEKSLNRLARWADGEPSAAEVSFARLVVAALTRIDRLVEASDPQGIVRKAAEIVHRLEPIASTKTADSAAAG